MSAQVESMMYKGAVPWHGLGTKISDDKNLSIEEGLKESGCDWNVVLEDMYLKRDMDEYITSQKLNTNIEERAVVRSTDNSVLGVVGSKYTPLQNMDSFAWFQPFLDAGLCKLHTAGSLCGGKKVWVLAELDNPTVNITANDTICKYILLSNSHDGSSAVRVGYTPIRTTCANTLAMAHNSTASKLLKVRHTSGLKISMEIIRDTMNVVNAEFEATAEQYKFLATKRVSKIRDYVKLVLKEDKEDKDMSTRSKNIVDKIVSLCENGIGNNIDNIGGTYWAAYNGVTEYLSRIYGRNNSNRMNNLWFGQGVNMNQLALQTALRMAS
jgi:phage/plasmid-like protein (TIGR03299 family)